jgi:phage shock protein A
MRDEESRRNQNRINQSVKRARERGLPLVGETEYLSALKAGDEALAEQVLEKYLPKSSG